MFKSAIAAIILIASTTALGSGTPFETLSAFQQNLINQSVQIQSLDWKVGDMADYSIDMGFIKGTMLMSVASVGVDGVWMTQDADLGFAGKQKIETLIDPNTGEVKKMLVNGKEQAIPEQDIEIIDMTEDRITVPAGTFDCIHARLKDKKENTEINAWINPSEIPMSGLIKQVAPSQFGNVTIELKSFKKQ